MVLTRLLLLLLILTVLLDFDQTRVVAVHALSSSSSSSSTSTSCSIQKRRHVVIVGGGVGGLAIAARIAASASALASAASHGKQKDDIQITILEKNEQVGGRCGSFDITMKEYGTFRHERGPSLLLLPHVYRELFDDCARISPRSTSSSASYYGLEMMPCIPAYQAVFDNGDCIHVGFPKQQHNPEHNAASAHALEMASRQTMDTWEPNGARKWDDYLQACLAFMNCGLRNFIQQRLDVSSFPAFLYESLRHYARAWPLRPHSDVLQAFFPNSSQLRALASFQDLYVGLEPFRNNDNDNHDEKNKNNPWWLGLGGGVMDTTAAAVFGLLAAIELHPTHDQCGVYAPIGGFQSVTNAMEQLCLDRNCIEMKCQQTVTKVTNQGVYYHRSSNDTAAANVQFHPADLIIVNADLPYAQATLLSKTKLPTASSSSSSKGQDGTDNGGTYQPSTTTSRAAEEMGPQEAAATEKEEEGEATKIRYDWNDRDYRFSSGVIAFHWCLNQTLDFLNTHNVYLSANTTERAQQSWQVLRRQRRGPGKQQDANNNDNHDDFWTTTTTHPHKKDANEEEEIFPPFNFYVHRPSKTDPTAAPKGCDSLLVLVPCPTLLRNPAYAHLPKDEAIQNYQRTQFTDVLIDRVRRAVLHRMAATTNSNDGKRFTSVQELRQSIIHEVVDTPATYADSWNVGAGTPFALSHGFGQLSLTRPSAKGTSILSPFQRQAKQHPSTPKVDNEMPNVLYVGASSRPGNGVPLVLIGAKLAAEQATALLFKHEKS